MPTPEMSVLFFYPTSVQPSFTVHVFPQDKADSEQLLVLGTALIQCASEAPKLLPVFLDDGKTHFGDEFWCA
jgi:hypothetical protein